VTSDLTLRPARLDDASACGRICYDAFGAISDQHNFPHDFPSPDVATGLLTMLLTLPGFYGVVAERDGRIVGSNFLHEHSPIAGVGPITVEPGAQNRGVGRRLMQAVLDRAVERSFPGVRLVQAGYHMRSLSLYTNLGFQVREPLVCMQGPPPGVEVPGRSVRPAHQDDLDGCNRVCDAVHGHHRGGDVAAAIATGTATVVEQAGRITGYTTELGFFGHAVGETDDDLKALIGAASSFSGPGMLVPARGRLFGWCLANGLRAVQPLTLMTVGLYNEPKGAFLPSILY
jgi:GNAT superfamily N-acetyltransferase